MSLILSGTDGLSDVDGSAATPAIRGTDANTGIFFPAADTIAFAEGGVESMRIDSSGNLGIGTVTPVAKLNVKTLDATNAAMIAGTTIGARFSSDSSGVYIDGTDPTGSASYQPLFTGGSVWGVRIAGTERMPIVSSGNVGIGTASPLTNSGTALVINGSRPNLRLTNPTTGVTAADGGEISQLGSDLIIENREAANIISYTNGAERTRIDSGGRLTVTSQPGFMAGIASTSDANVTANSIVPFNTVTATGAFNTGTNFSTGTSLFTAPIAGRYMFSYTLYLSNSGSSTQAMSPAIRINGSFVSFTSGDVYGLVNATPNSTGGTISISASVILNLAANDTVGVAARSTTLRIYQGHCFFSGYLLG